MANDREQGRDAGARALVVMPSPPVGLDPTQALQALVMAQGDPALAADRLGLASGDALLAALALDERVHDQARAVFRFFELTAVQGATRRVQDKLLEYLDDDKLDPRDIVRLYPALVTAVELLTKGGAAAGGSTTNINIYETIMRAVPPEVRGALRALMPGGPALADGETDEAAGGRGAAA